jgi:hypothetical protein
VKPTLLNELPVFGFVIVKLSVLLAFKAMVLGLKPTVTVGGATTRRLAVAVLPIPPSVELIWALALLAPAVVPDTVTEIVHDVFVGSEPPLSCTVDPEFASDAVPPQPLLVTVPPATRPLLRVALNASPWSVMLLAGLLIVNVSEVIPVSGMLGVAPNATEMLGGAATVKDAVADPPVLALLVPMSLVVVE